MARTHEEIQIMTAEATCTLEPSSPVNTDADLLVSDLVARARSGDRQAWDALVELYAPLIWSICRAHRLGDADANRVGQRVWQHLVQHIDRVRDLAGLARWLATTTRRECLRVPRTRAAEREVLAAERQAALREALLALPPGYRQLISLFIQDPLVPDAQISATLGIPVGDIGPARRRCLDELRHHPAIKDAGYLDIP